MPATTKTRKAAPVAAAPGRPTHVAVEIRVETEEAEHLAHWLGRLAELVGREVLNVPRGWVREDEAVLIGKLAERCRQAA